MPTLEQTAEHALKLKAFAVGQKFRPKRHCTSPREIIDARAGEVKYRTFADGRNLPLIRWVERKAFLRWTQQHEARCES